MAGRAELDRGRSLRAKCKSLSKTTWNHHERRQNNSVENAFQRFEWSFVFFLRRKHDFGRKIAAFVWRILFEKPRIWHAQWLSCCKNTSGWRPWYQERLVLKFLMTRFNENSQLISLEKTLTYTLTISDFFVFWKSMLHPFPLRFRKKTYAGLLEAFKRAILTLWLWRAFTKILNCFHWWKTVTYFADIRSFT